MTPAPARKTTDPLALARTLGIGFAIAAVAAGGAHGGVDGAVAAALGAGLSALNLWAIERLAARAAHRAVFEGGAVAASGLTAGLTAKTTVFLMLIWLVTRAAGVPVAPFTLGLLVFVFALVGAGVWAAARQE